MKTLVNKLIYLILKKRMITFANYISENYSFKFFVDEACELPSGFFVSNHTGKFYSKEQIFEIFKTKQL